MSTDRWPFLGGSQIRIAKTEGCYLIADDGRRIFDAAGGAIVANVGHGRDEVHAALSSSADYVVPIFATPEREALVDRLRSDWLPPALSRVHLTCGGSEANEAAVKIALQYQVARGQPQRTEILSRDISYHGTTLAMAGISGHPARRRGLEGYVKENAKFQSPYPLRAPADVPTGELGAYYLKSLRETIERVGTDRVAAVLIEPITGTSGGAIVPPADYLPGVRALCDEFGIVMIADEIMTGFGRTGTRFGCDHWQVVPDVLVAGKGLAGGYAPIAGVFSSEQIAAPIRAAGYDVMFHTFGALPSACAASNAVLEIMKREALVERAQVMGTLLNERLHATFDQHPHVAEVRGVGLLQAIEIVRDRDTLEPFAAEAGITGRVVSAGLENEVFFYPGGTMEVRDIIGLGPPFIVTEAEVDQMVGALARSVDKAVAHV